MNERETCRYETLGRVDTFGKNNAADFTPDSEGTKRFANVARIITDLDAAKASQKPGGVTAKEVLLDALRLDLQNITRTARALAQDEPGFADKFRLPDNSSQTALITAADAFLVELKKPGIADRLIAYELPSDFVENLAEDRAAIVAAATHLESGRTGGVASIAAIGRLISDGMKEVTYLNAIMYNKYARTPDKLRAWLSASHVERAAQREKTPAPPTPPAPRTA